MGGQMTKVLPNLFIGANENAGNERELIANCITHILTVQTDEAEIKKLSHCEYLRVFVGKPASTSLFRVIPQTNDFIHAARQQAGNVLVHSESGMSSNVAVVAAYLMTVYGLNSKVAVSTLQGLVPAANPVNTLQNQLDRFDPSAPAEVRGDIPISAASERQRLIERFGQWEYMERDERLLKEALAQHDELKASGAFIISSGEGRPRQRTPSPPPNSQVSKFVPPLEQNRPPKGLPIFLTSDRTFRLEDTQGVIDEKPDYGDNEGNARAKEDDDGQIPMSPSDSEASLADEDAIVGSIPVPRRMVPPIGAVVIGSMRSTTVAPNGAATRAQALGSGGEDLDVGGEGVPIFEMTDEIRMRLDAADAAAVAAGEHFPSTAPVYHDFTKPSDYRPGV